MKDGWKYSTIDDTIDNLRTGLNPRTHFKLNTEDATGYYITVRELDGFRFIVDDATDMVSETALKRINQRSNLKIGDVLFSGTGTLGRTALVTEEPTWWNIKEGVYALSPKKDVLDSKFLIYSFMSDVIMNKIRKKASGTTIKSIPMKELKKIEIPVPPLSEQQRIVTYLDDAFAKIDLIKQNAEKSLSEAKALFQSTLKEMMEPKEGWEEYNLKDISKYSIGLTYKPTNVCDDGTIVLRSSNIQNGKLDLNDIVRVNAPIKDSLYVETGDILMCSRNGSARLVGKVCIIPELQEKMTYGTFMMVIKSVYNPILYYFFDSDNFRAQIKHGEANMINQITRYMLDDVKVFLPSTMEQQQQIVSRLDTLSETLHELEANYTKTVAECGTLKQALLRQVFE